jgi:exopolysaccharide production protein ExoQ
MVGKDPTLTGRTDLWFYAARFISDNSLLGVGYHAFWVQGHALPEYLWRLEHVDTRSGFTFHNLFLELMVEIGLPGVVCGSATLTGTFLSVVRWMRTDTSSEAIFFFCMGVFLIIMQMLATSLFEVFDPWNAAFSLALIYSRTRGYAPVRRMRPVPVRGMRPRHERIQPIGGVSGQSLGAAAVNPGGWTAGKRGGISAAGPD